MAWREQFPSLEDDIDRRIEHSEGRIKYWVIAGVLANLVALVGIGAPMIYYFGSMQAQTQNTLQTVLTISTSLTDIETRIQRQEVRQQMLDAWAESQGYRRPISQ